jgi:hypothetical protein
MITLIKAGMNISYIWDKFFIHPIIVLSLFFRGFSCKKLNFSQIKSLFNEYSYI